MRKEAIDIILINLGDRKQVYQDLGKKYSAIEPPFWVAVMASYLRNSGFDVEILDANAENITPEETSLKVKSLNPLLVAVIVYGSNPSASTQNMTVAGKICKALKIKNKHIFEGDNRRTSSIGIAKKDISCGRCNKE